MARFYRLEVLSEIVRVGLVPLYYNPDINVIMKVVDACVQGGASIFEFTNRGDNAFRIFSDLVKYVEREHPSLILGAGSVIDPGTGALYISCGANFLVGSVLNPDLAKVCNRRKIAYIPGCGSAYEISNAEELGVEIVKVFPGGAVGGPGFVKSILGPTPWTKIMPTGGVRATKENITEWFNAGVAAVGIGSDLVKKEWVKAENYNAIAELTSKVITWIQEAKNPSVSH